MSIKGVGTSDADELAYVECELHDGNVHALIFSSDISSNLCSAFLSAAAHLQLKRKMRGLPADESYVDIHQTKMTTAVSPEGETVLFLDLLTKSGAQVSFRLNKQLAQSVAKKLSGLMNPQIQ